MGLDRVEIQKTMQISYCDSYLGTYVNGFCRTKLKCALCPRADYNIWDQREGRHLLVRSMFR